MYNALFKGGKISSGGKGKRLKEKDTKFPNKYCIMWGSNPHLENMRELAISAECNPREVTQVEKRYPLKSSPRTFGHMVTPRRLR